MQSAGSILRKFIRDYGLESGLALSGIRGKWKTIAGQTVAAHTFPDSIRGKTLFITVDSVSWIHHLSFYKVELCNKLENYDIRELRFKVGKLPESREAGRQKRNGNLTDEEAGCLADMLKSLKDNELKQRFRSLIVHAFESKRVE